MGFKDEYYYAGFISEASYSKTPSRIIDPLRLRQNKPCFKKPIEATIQKKKTLVFNLPNDFFTSDSMLQVLRSRIDALLKEGFTLYTQGNRQLQNLNQTNYRFMIFDSTSNNKLKVTNESLAQQVMHAYSLTADEVLVLDSDKTAALIDGDASDWLFLDPFKTIDLTNSVISSASLADLLHLHGPKIQNLKLIKNNNLSIQLPENIDLSSLRNLTIELPYSFRIIKLKWDIHPLLRNSGHLESITLSGLETEKDFLGALKNQGSLKVLKLENCILMAHPVDDYHFCALESLKVSACQMNPNMLKSYPLHITG